MPRPRETWPRRARRPRRPDGRPIAAAAVLVLAEPFEIFVFFLVDVDVFDDKVAVRVIVVVDCWLKCFYYSLAF